MYGKLIYQLLGEKAEKRFVSAWGIGIGMGQVQEARDVFVSVLQVAAAMTVLEVLWIVTNVRWLESNADYLSVHATIAGAGGRSWWRTTRAYSRFYKCVASCSAVLESGTPKPDSLCFRPCQGRGRVVKGAERDASVLRSSYVVDDTSAGHRRATRVMRPGIGTAPM